MRQASRHLLALFGASIARCGGATRRSTKRVHVNRLAAAFFSAGSWRCSRCCSDGALIRFYVAMLSVELALL